LLPFQTNFTWQSLEKIEELACLCTDLLVQIGGMSLSGKLELDAQMVLYQGTALALP
jgi:hypothetical protein